MAPLKFVFLLSSFIFLEFLIIIALSIFFTTFTSPIISLFATISVFIIGHITDSVLEFALYSKSLIFNKIGHLIYFIFPNLNYFSLKNELYYNQFPQVADIVFRTIYGVCIVALFLMLAMIIFRRKEF